jgi:hypothetical protein
MGAGTNIAISRDTLEPDLPRIVALQR